MLPGYTSTIPEKVIKEGNLVQIKAIIRKEKIDFRSDSALFVAVKYGDLKIVKYLISQGADPHGR
jgi:ankyrin repeat protein